MISISSFIPTPDSHILGPPKNLLYWCNSTDPKIRPDPTFKKKKKKRTKKNDRPILKKAKPVIFFFFVFKHLILAPKMLILKLGW